MKKGDIVAVVAVTGEYIGRLESIDDSGVRVTNPRLIVKGEDGSIGFGRGVSMSAEENVREVVFLNPIFVAPAHEKFQSPWIEFTSGIVV